jgi:Tol biopolymer transport system component
MKTQNARIVFSAIGMVVLLALAWLAGDALSGAIEPPTHFALYVINADGSGQKILRDDSTFELWGPAWSPDGQQIAVSLVSGSGDKSEIYLLDSNGQNPHPLTHNGQQNYLPAWSHDGKRIAFVSQQGKDTQSSEIYVINADGSNEQRLTRNQAPEYGATWSPDDRQFAFGSKADGNWQIYLMDADGANQHPLAVRADGSAPVWSPDGQQLSITSEREGSANIYTLTPDGQNQRNLTNDNTASSNSSWSPDGSKIAFWSERYGMPSIFVMDRDGSNPIDLTNAPDFEALNPSWSPDGRQIVFQAAQHETGIPKLIRGNLSWIFVGIVGLMALGILAKITRRNRKAAKE